MKRSDAEVDVSLDRVCGQKVGQTFDVRLVIITNGNTKIHILISSMFTMRGAYAFGWFKRINTMIKDSAGDLVYSRDQKAKEYQLQRDDLIGCAEYKSNYS